MLELRNLTFSYGSETILAGLDLTVPRGQFLSLLGPSGSGKTTLLRILAGLEPPGGGTVRWRGAPLDGPSLRRGIVFQDYSLFPWMTLRQNVELAIRKARPALQKGERRDLAEQFIGLVGLGDAASKHPHELSGGMRQRGAIARAFALSSDVLLLDEPFGALDPVNRARLQDLLLEVWAASEPRKTVVLVTHDVDEALVLGDRVVVLGSAPGRVIADFPVPFPHPRVRRALFASREYVELEERIANHYRQDVIERIERPDLVEGVGDRI